MNMVQFRLLASLVLLIAFAPRLPLNQGELWADLFAYAWLGLGVLIILANAQEWLRMRRKRKAELMAERRKRLAAQKKLARSV